MAGESLIVAFQRILDALHQGQFEYAVCGGLAVNIHGHVRSTTDIDFIITEDDRDQILEMLRGLGYTFVAGPIPFDSGTNRERVLHRASRIEGGETMTVDLLVVTPILEEVWRQREEFEWEGRRIKVVSLGGLTKMKLMAGRHQDLADLENLGVEFSDDND